MVHKLRLQRVATFKEALHYYGEGPTEIDCLEAVVALWHICLEKHLGLCDNTTHHTTTCARVLYWVKPTTIDVFVVAD